MLEPLDLFRAAWVGQGDLALNELDSRVGVAGEHKNFLFDELLVETHRRLLQPQLLLACLRQMRVRHSNQASLVQSAESLLDFLAGVGTAAIELPSMLLLGCHVVVEGMRDRHIDVEDFFREAKRAQRQVHLPAVRVAQSVYDEVHAFFLLVKKFEAVDEISRVQRLVHPVSLAQVRDEFFQLAFIDQAVTAEQAPWKVSLDLRDSEDELVHQGLEDGLPKHRTRLQVLLPGQVAEFHLEAQDFEEIKTALLGRLREDFMLDDIDEDHDVAVALDDEVQGRPVLARERDALPREDTVHVLALTLVILVRLTELRLLHHLIHVTIAQQSYLPPLVVVIEDVLDRFALLRLDLNRALLDLLESARRRPVLYASDLAEGELATAVDSLPQALVLFRIVVEQRLLVV